MSAEEIKGKPPQDLVAIFHASFHPTEGNVLDWAVTASDDLNLDRLEFSALPSGLHLVEQDTIYFTKDGQHGVCVFRRRKTTEHGHRGFRLSSLGILLAKTSRPRPWRHVKPLRDLIDRIYSRVELSESLQPGNAEWDLARAFFEERKLRRADLGGAGDWNGWEDELLGTGRNFLDASPTVHLPHLLRILGPSCLTLYKHVLGRRRILILTLPPVEAACILCQVAADICYDYQVEPKDGSSHVSDKVKGRSREPINVLGMVTLSDVDRLYAEGKTGRGWIACTTDAIFLEKPSYYDLLIDLTTSTPNKATRPSFYSSKQVPCQPGSKGPSYRLSTIRFAWSDVKLWNEIDRILQQVSDKESHHSCCGPSSSPEAAAKLKSVSTWTDAWRVYEDVCIICAGLWIGSWRGNSAMSYSTANGPENWGAVRLDGDDDLTLRGTYVRNVGMGIEGGPKPSAGVGIGSPATPTPKAQKRSSAVSWSSGRATVAGGSSAVANGKTREVSSSLSIETEELYHELSTVEHSHHGQVLTTLALIQTFHAHISFQVSILQSFLPRGITSDGTNIVCLTPKDILAFELGPLSGADARYLEWLAQEYGGGATVVVKRSWRDLIGVIFGYT